MSWERSTTRWFGLWSLCLLAAACDASPLRGGEGESCTRRDDCAHGLKCLAQVCVGPADGGSDAADGAVASAPALASEGEGCIARRDCALGLLCVAGSCAMASLGTDPTGRASGVGESCRATNDCAQELACVGNVCVAVTLSLSQTAKQCHRVECAKDDDCCAAFVPNASCPAYKDNCDTDPVFCNTYRSLCECSQHCIDELCMVSAPGCTVSSECTSLQTPFCVGGTCRQCEGDANCPGEGAKCVEGVCMAACVVDEQCPPQHDCMDGECVDVGCQTDRECVFMSGEALSSCVDGTCQTPCDTDSDCKSEQSPFQACVAGKCVFVGCETDAECRALLGLSSQPGTARAECR